MSDASGSTQWAYDAMGRVLKERRTIGANTKNITYTYNLGGLLTSITYPSGRTVEYTNSNAARPLSTIDTTTPGSPINYAEDAEYEPFGALRSALHGQRTGFDGITRTYTYNNRLQYATIKAEVGGTARLDLIYGYPSPNNSNVTSITNNRDANRTQTYAYDHLDRIDTAQTQGSAPDPNCWGQNCDYDEAEWGHVGNLNKITVTKCSADGLNMTINWKNQITAAGFSYDLAGNLIDDGPNSYTWNGENRLRNTAGVDYTYDGDGWRVKNDQTSGSTYDKLQWRSIFGYLLAESDLSGNITREYIYFAGKRIARRDVSSGNVYYFFQDHLESTRVITDQNGATVRESDYYAFGGERVVGTATVDDPHKFAGMYQDAESGQYYTWGRIYSPNLGRFLSPDPVAGSIGAPQSLNRYAYALNNPTNFADPLGLTSLCIITIECYYIIYPVPPHAFERINLGCHEIGRRCTKIADPKAELRKIAQYQLANAKDSCHAMQQTFAAAFGLYDSKEGAANAVTETFTEVRPWLGHPDWPRPDASSTTVGWRGAQRFDSSGFQTQFTNPASPSDNQVRHFVGYFNGGFQSSYQADKAMEAAARDSIEDRLLGEAGVRLGRAFDEGQLSVDQLLDQILRQICK